MFSAMNKEQFNKWQEYMNEQAFVVPVQYHYSVVPVSTKDGSWYTVSLTK